MRISLSSGVSVGENIVYVEVEGGEKTVELGS